MSKLRPVRRDPECRFRLTAATGVFPSPDAGEVGAVLIGVALETIEEVVGSDPTAVDHGMAVEEDDVPALGFSRGDGVLHGSDPR